MIQHIYPADCITPEQKKKHRRDTRNALREDPTLTPSTVPPSPPRVPAVKGETKKSRRQRKRWEDGNNVLETPVDQLGLDPEVAAALQKSLDISSGDQGLDWSFRDLPVSVRRDLDAIMSMTDVKRLLRGWGRPYCDNCEERIYPWQNMAEAVKQSTGFDGPHILLHDTCYDENEYRQA